MDLDFVTDFKEIIIIIFSIVAIYISFSKKVTIIEQKIEELNKSVMKHNNLVERIYKLEQRVEDLDGEQQKDK